MTIDYISNIVLIPKRFHPFESKQIQLDENWLVEHSNAPESLKVKSRDSQGKLLEFGGREVISGEVVLDTTQFRWDKPSINT